MEFPLLGVIPTRSSKIIVLTISVNKIIAAGIEHSVYIFDTLTGENIARVNHYPHTVIAATWHPCEFLLVSADTSGEVLFSNFKSMSCEKRVFSPGILNVYYHWSCEMLYVQYAESVVLYNSRTIEKVKEVEVSGIKLLLDYFSPEKVIVLHKNGIKVIRNVIGACKINEGKIEELVDAAINPTVINMIYALKRRELIEYDIYSHRCTRVIASYSYNMLQILSSYSTEVWTLSEKGIINHQNVMLPINFYMLSTGLLNSDGKLPVCFITSDLELQYGLYQNSIEIQSRVSLGISLNFWSFCYLNEKVLIFYSNNCIHCFSFLKERTVRKIKVLNLVKLSCCLGCCYYVTREQESSVFEWKISTGEIKLIKSYEANIKLMEVNVKGTHLALGSDDFLEIATISKQKHKIERLDIKKASAIIWSETDLILYACTSTEFFKIQPTDDGETSYTVLIKGYFSVTEILEIGEDLYVHNNEWCKLVPAEHILIPENVEKIDEINIGLTKAEFKSFGLLYRNFDKSLHFLSYPHKLLLKSPGALEQEFVLDYSPDALLPSLLKVAEYENNSRLYVLLKIIKEQLDTFAEEPEDPPVEKTRARLKDRSFQSSPGTITPSRRPVKRSISPLNKSRKSITPSRISKMQTDPKDLIQLAVDTSSLLNSTTNFQKEPSPKLFYVLETAPTLKSPSSTPGDFLTSDKKALIKKLQNSTEEKDVLLSCIIAGSLGRQELHKAVEFACSKLNNQIGVCLNLALGSKSKAWEILLGDSCEEDLAYYSRVSGKFDEFFTWIISLYEDEMGFACAVHLLASGFIGLCLQILCRVNEERTAYWVAKCFEGSWRNRKEIPTEFEGWFYEIGAPRFRSRIEEEIQAMYAKYEQNRLSSL